MIQIVDVTKIYGKDKLVLDRINIKIEKGDIFILLGANGAGKTTLINMMLNFIRLTGGDIIIGGKSILKNPLETKKNISYLPEVLMLYENLSAWQNIDFFTNLNNNKQIKKCEVEKTLETLSFPISEINSKVKTFSKGMRQKCGLTISLLSEAKLYLLDEPTTGLDVKSISNFVNYVVSNKSEKCYFITTHDIQVAKKTATRIGLLKNRRIEKEFKKEDFDIIDYNLFV